MKKDLTLNIRVDAEMREALERWCSKQPADTSYGAFFRYAAKKVLIESECLSPDYAERSIRKSRERAAPREEAVDKPTEGEISQQKC
jgi:hypothetical protein